MTTIGGARFFLGDPGGEEVLQEALGIALAANLRIAGTVLNNLSVMASITDTRRSMALLVESQDFGERMGDREQFRFTNGNLVHDIWATGRWDEALTSAGSFIAACESGSPTCSSTSFVRCAACCSSPVERRRQRSRISGVHASSKTNGASRDIEIPMGYPRALRCSSDGQTRADAYAQEFAASFRPVQVLCQSRHAWTALFAEELGIAPPLREFAEASLPGRLRDAALAALDGDLRRAADVFDAAGLLPCAAHARTLAAEELFRTGERAEGEAELVKALEFYRSVGATFFIERCDALLHQVKTA